MESELRNRLSSLNYGSQDSNIPTEEAISKKGKPAQAKHILLWLFQEMLQRISVILSGDIRIESYHRQIYAVRAVKSKSHFSKIKTLIVGLNGS